jgi:transposase
MQMVTTIGLDVAKSVFQVHGVDAAGQVVIRRQLKRRYVPCGKDLVTEIASFIDKILKGESVGVSARWTTLRAPRPGSVRSWR